MFLKRKLRVRIKNECLAHDKNLYKQPPFLVDSMEVKILEDKKRRLVFELKGSDHGFCNALKKELWNDDAVTLASYSIEHPLVGVPRFILETSTDKEPKDVLKKAIDRLRKQAEQFKAEVKKFK